ncbi:MAG TPA: hypothetical protein VNT51_06385 [Miltoncostaeaceae bacterium]|nr:hypothetical protein [Miltoncostaeaceae bacterium]
MKGYRTKKISLPGGRVIEIVYFSDPDPGQGGEHTTAAEAVEAPMGAGLHVCDECGSDLVYPVSWEEREGDTWRIDRRCPNCEWGHTGEFHQSEVEVFDDVLNDGTEALLASLRTMARANMQEDVERMISALERDLIEPMDF